MGHDYVPMDEALVRVSVDLGGRGQDYHHVVEAVFKALGRALREASKPDGTQNLPTTKGVVGSS